MKVGIVLFAVLLAIQAHASTVEQGRSKQPELIPWWSVNAGGNVYSGSGNYRLSSSVGQAAAGKAEGANYVMHAGFWNPAILAVGIQEGIVRVIPEVHSITQNYPNPFHGHTQIRYAIPRPEKVRVEVFNITGQSVRVLVDREETPGYRVVSWDGRDEDGLNLGCGVYFYRMTTSEFQATRKMLLLR